MQADPIAEWQRLTEHYRQLSDVELYELYDDIGNLTDTARQVLRSEMKSRGLGEVQARNTALPTPAPIPAAYSTADNRNADDGPREYTWKTPLCECETSEEARQLCEALKQVGIESWIDGPRPSAHSGYASLEMTNLRVLVAADQLEQARAIAANPIPQEIVDRFKEEVPEYQPPMCPMCGASDPVLEEVDPRNTWRCEQCGEQWTESAESGEGELENGGDLPL